ncbi:MAG TPA: LamG domain-containing protein, partial [Candidatus Saccharimonadales bacterium]|nr:LamG domain-containing protein [Candidatus Saccharimonadales bacterium]
IVLLIAGSAYAAINLTTGSPPEHNSLTPGINLAQGEKGLIGWWKLNGNTKDATPYQNNGTLSNPAPTPTTDRMGTTNGAYSFDGASNYITANTAPNMASPWSIAGWVETPVNYGSNVFPVAFGFYLDTTHRVGVGFSGGRFKISSGGETGASGGLYSTNTWYHLVMVWTGSQLQLYVNGALNYSVTPTGNNWRSSTMTIIGQDGTSSANHYLQGSVADVRLYNRALSASDITDLYDSYNSQVNLYSPPGSGNGVNLTAGLIGYWPFAGNARDATPYSNNGTVHGAMLTTGRSGQPNTAYLTGNTNSWIAVGSPSAYANLTSSGFTYNIWLMRPADSTYHWPEIMGAANTHVFYGIRSQNYGDGISFEYGLSPYDGTAYTNTGSFSLPVGEWHMFTATYDGAHLNFYRDGVLVFGPATEALNPTFGGLNFTGSINGWVGSMDDARLYNRALSAAEVQALYNLPD